MIQKYLSKKRGRVYVAFIDLKRAFDSIDHRFLIFKLKKAGLKQNILNIIISMYSKLTAQVKVGNTISNQFRCLIGIQQGSPLSSFLFNLFINDLSEILNSSEIANKIQIGDMLINHLLYADDLVLINDTVFGLQSSLNKLATYCDKWGLTVNIEKSNIVVFKNGGNLKKIEKWYYKGVLLQVVKFYNYLGVVFNSRGTWTDAMSSNCTKANKALFTLKRLVHKRFGNLPINLWNQIFDIKILPILLYGNEIWGVNDMPIIEKFHSKFCRWA